MQQCRHGFAAPRLLVIENGGLIASVTAEALNDEGYAMRTAGDGREALQQVLAWAPCLILLDILMPKMDGRAFLPALWQLEERAETPVVLASGADGPLLRDANIRIADVIRKAFSLEQLVATAERLATQRSPDQHRTRHQPPDRGMRPAPSAVIAVVSCGDRRRCRRLTGR